jgi:sensor histidine kinase YesM
MRRPAVTVAVVIAAWAGNAWFFVQQQVLAFAMAGESIGTGILYAAGFRSAAIWSALTLLLIGSAVVRRLRDRPIVLVIAVHLLLALVFSALDVAVDRATNDWIGARGAVTFGAAYFSQLNGNLFSYCVVAGVLHALDARRLSRERVAHATELKHQLSRARLELLRTQLQPHFLFNTLHATAALLHRDPKAAERIILRLGDLLRAAMETTDQPVVTVADELELLQAYLEIQEIRFRDCLTISVEIEPGVEDAQVPNLLLQPLVENAIKHGTGRQPGPGWIRIAVRRSGDELRIEVANSGQPHSIDAPGDGIGLSNTRARLTELYGDRHHFEVALWPEGGAVARIRIPYGEVDDGPGNPQRNVS